MSIDNNFYVIYNKFSYIKQGGTDNVRLTYGGADSGL